MRSDAELSDYQKRLESIDNVILCIAEAERYVLDLGKSLVDDLDKYKEIAKKKKYPKCPWRVHKYWR
jgi:hypothetical protein